MTIQELNDAICKDKDTADVVRYRPGENLFLEGDRGGDLYLIEFGDVDIYRTSKEKDLEVQLTKMHKGELIGLFTCLNDGERTASARAASPTRCRIIRHERIKKAIGNLPKWFTIILKEYGVRLAEVEDRLMGYLEEAEVKRRRLFSAVTEARFLCHNIATLCQYEKIVVEKEEFVVIEDIIAKLSDSLGLDIERVNQLFLVLQDAGLFLPQIEPDKKRKVVPLSNCEQVIDFSAFIKLTRGGKTRKMVSDRWSSKSFALARAIIKLAQVQGQSMTSEITMNVEQMAPELKRVTGVEYDEDLMVPLNDYLLIKTKAGSNKQDIIEFQPNKVGRVIAHIIAFQQLTLLDNTPGGAKRVA